MPRRPLNPFERAEAEQVFANSVKYDHIQIVEDDWFALAVAKVGSRITGGLPPKTNAVTLCNTIRFSRALMTMESAQKGERIRDTGWLIHELTHVWQYQHVGLRYLAEAIGIQLTKGQDAYPYSIKKILRDRGEELKEMWAKGTRFHHFNREQQGDIVRDYYTSLKNGEDTSGWVPFINEIRSIV